MHMDVDIDRDNEWGQGWAACNSTLSLHFLFTRLFFRFSNPSHCVCLRDVVDYLYRTEYQVR
jgi:hypothetical protein